MGIHKMGLGQGLVEALLNNENVKVGDLLGRLDATTVNETGVLGYTPLHAGCVQNNEEAVSKLLTVPGIGVNARDHDGLTAIIHAALCDSTEAVILLLDHPEVEVNAKDNNGWTALTWAAALCKLGSVRLLLNHLGVDLEILTNDGKRLEMMAGSLVDGQDPLCLDMIRLARRNRENSHLEQAHPSNENVLVSSPPPPPTPPPPPPPVHTEPYR